MAGDGRQEEVSGKEASVTKEILLNTGEVVLVDDEDYPLLSRCSWQRAGSYGYAVTTMQGVEGKNHTVYMHKLIVGGFWMADHKDGNVLDCRKQNLRSATRQENNFNMKKMKLRKGKPTSSKYKGVFFDKNMQRFRAGINKDRKRYDLGAFDLEDDAGRAYNKMAIELFGEFAWLNTVPELA
jgi:hypothetical protein